MLMRDVCMILYKSGFRHFVFIHGHDESLPSMMVGAQNLVEEAPEAQAIILNWLTPLSKVYGTIQPSKKSEGHGGEGETARLLVTYPELVHPEPAKPFTLSQTKCASYKGRSISKVVAPFLQHPQISE